MSKNGMASCRSKNSRGGSVSVGIATPCARTAAAIEDYIRIVLKYENYAGYNCWLRLPSAIQQAHKAHVLQIAAMAPVAEILVAKYGSTIAAIGTGGIKTPCFSSKGATEDYRDVVVKYEKYSGSGCWRMLPKEVQAAHNSYVATVSALADYAKNLTGGAETVRPFVPVRPLGFRTMGCPLHGFVRYA